jgi:hypothetical protein
MPRHVFRREFAIRPSRTLFVSETHTTILPSAIGGFRTQELRSWRNMSTERENALRKQVPLDIRVVDKDTLVSLRRKGESIGLSGQWSSDQLVEKLSENVRLPIWVILINTTSGPQAPLAGSCYRCLVASLGQYESDSQFQIDLDSVDYESLDLMSSRDVLLLTRYLN